MDKLAAIVTFWIGCLASTALIIAVVDVPTPPTPHARVLAVAAIAVAKAALFAEFVWIGAPTPSRKTPRLRWLALGAGLADPLLGLCLVFLLELVVRGGGVAFQFVLLLAAGLLLPTLIVSAIAVGLGRRINNANV